MADKSIEQRIYKLELEGEEKEKQCENHTETTQRLEAYVNQHNIEHARITAEIEGKASKEALKDLKSGWIGHAIQAAIAIGGFLILIFKSGGGK